MARLPEPLRALARAWRVAVEAPRLRAVVAGGALVLTLALLVARRGTAASRAGALAAIVVFAAALVAGWLHERRVFQDAARTIARVAGRTEPELARRAQRALTLLEDTSHASRGTSRELAHLHVERALAALPLDAVRRDAGRLGLWIGVSAVGIAAAALVAMASNPWGVLEGADVLLARDGEAPLGMTWLTDVRIVSRPPEYLHQDERRVLAYEGAELPHGSLITVSGEPVHAGRSLFLAGGDVEIPFVDDGAGHMVARWPLEGDTKLRVVARFGRVIIPEPEATPIASIEDAPPVVALEGAPRRIMLAAEEELTDLPIHYEASDDHGLREVHLVLRAGAREERRVLARLDGETRNDRGGYSLRANDAFLRKSHAPIEVRVEAKDNDVVTGPKWGASASLTIVPPDVGEPQARRLAGLVQVRDSLVDALAFRLTTPLPVDPKERRAVLDRDAKWSDDNGELLEQVLTTSHAGVRVSGRLGAMLRGRMRKVKEAIGNQARSPSTAARAAVVKASERMVLVVDAVIRGQGLRDTREVAKELATVAEELANAATASMKADERARGEERMDASVLVLSGGGRAMRRLGALGRDLGEIVAMDLKRVERARKESDLVHATLAAQDLAARLHLPDPSFGASGGHPSHAGGEAGGARGAPGADEEGEGSDVEQAFDEALQDLERLAADHAGNMGRVEQALSGGTTEDDRKRLEAEAKKHADRVREAAKGLPMTSGGSDSWTSKGSAAREHAEQMARALEDGNAADAVQSGQSAASSLDEAKRAAVREAQKRFGDRGAEKSVDAAQKVIEQELAWAEDKLAELKRRAAQRAAPEVREHGETENKLADRARELGKKGRDREALPPAALEALDGAEQAAREAARALKEGDAERGQKHQRDAQQRLEAARDALGDGEGEGEGRADGDQGRMAKDHADIPKADAHKGPEEFRKRVLKGLGQSNGASRFKDAVKRYAEGLLR